MARAAAGSRPACTTCGVTWYAAKIGYFGACLTCAAAEPAERCVPGPSVCPSRDVQVTKPGFEQSSRPDAHAVFGKRHSAGIVPADGFQYRVTPLFDARRQMAQQQRP